MRIFIVFLIMTSNNVPTLTAVLESSSEALLLAPGRLVMLRRLELRGERMLERECFRDCDGAPIGEDGMGEDGGDMAMSMVRLFHLYSQTEDWLLADDGIIGTSAQYSRAGNVRSGKCNVVKARRRDADPDADADADNVLANR